MAGFKKQGKKGEGDLRIAPRTLKQVLGTMGPCHGDRLDDSRFITAVDENGVLQKFMPEGVFIDFGGRIDLKEQYEKVCGSRDVAGWQELGLRIREWVDEDGYSFQKFKVYAAFLAKAMNVLPNDHTGDKQKPAGLGSSYAGQWDLTMGNPFGGRWLTVDYPLRTGRLKQESVQGYASAFGPYLVDDHVDDKLDSAKTNSLAKELARDDSRLKTPAEKLDVVLAVMSRQDEITSTEDVRRVYDTIVREKLGQ